MSPNSSPDAHGRKRLDYLDSIRALSAIAVAYLHGALEFDPKAKGFEKSILHFSHTNFDPGKVGVLLFFMVSGFIIPTSFRFDRPTKTVLRDFLIGRLFRLYPIYWVSILTAFIILFRGDCPIYKILLNLTMFQAFVAPPEINMIGVYWTLQIEWTFYILCIVLFCMGWLSKPSRLLWTYVAFMLLSFAMAVVRFKTHRQLPLAAPLGLSLMLAAALWRMLVLDRRLDVRRYVVMALGSMFVLIVPISLLAYNYDAGHGENWYRYTVVYWLSMSLFMLLTTKVKLTWKPLVVVGQASFSLYLFNEPLHQVLEQIVPPARFAIFSPLLYIFFSILVACLCSLPLYEWCEKPMIRIGKKFTRRVEYPLPASVDDLASRNV